MFTSRRGHRSKYAAVPTVMNGVTFASKREARRYRELALLVSAGEIRDLVTHPVFPLHGVNLATGEVTTIGEYRGDFAYRIETGALVVEDVKGMATLALSRWKQKHVRAEHGITVTEVR